MRYHPLPAAWCSSWLSSAIFSEKISETLGFICLRYLLLSSFWSLNSRSESMGCWYHCLQIRVLITLLINLLQHPLPNPLYLFPVALVVPIFTEADHHPHLPFLYFENILLHFQIAKYLFYCDQIPPWNLIASSFLRCCNCFLESMIYCVWIFSSSLRIS